MNTCEYIKKINKWEKTVETLEFLVFYVGLALFGVWSAVDEKGCKLIWEPGGGGRCEGLEGEEFALQKDENGFFLFKEKFL